MSKIRMLFEKIIRYAHAAIQVPLRRGCPSASEGGGCWFCPRKRCGEFLNPLYGYIPLRRSAFAARRCPPSKGEWLLSAPYPIKMSKSIALPSTIPIHPHPSAPICGCNIHPRSSAVAATSPASASRRFASGGPGRSKTSGTACYRPEKLPGRRPSPARRRRLSRPAF